MTDAEGKALNIVLLSKKVYTKATTLNTGSWRSLLQHCKSGHQQAFRKYQVVTNSVTNFKLFSSSVFAGIRDPDYIMHNMKSTSSQH